MIPLLDFRMDQLKDFLENTPFPEDGDIYIAIRASFELEGHTGRWVILGAGVFPAGTIQDTTEYSWDLVERFCLLNPTDAMPEDPALAQAWRDLREVHAKFAEEHRQKEAAKDRSLSLLRGHLNERQLAELDEHLHFTVQARDGRPYRISTKHHGNVWLLSPEGKEVLNFCIVVKDPCIPVFDQMLTQKLMLEYDLDSFFEIANPRAPRPEV